MCYQRPARYIYDRGFPLYCPTFIYCVPPARPQQQAYAANVRPYGGRPVAPQQAPSPWGNTTAASSYPPRPDYEAKTNSVPAPYPLPYPGYAANYPQPAPVHQLSAAPQQQNSQQQAAYAQATTANQYAPKADSGSAVESSAVYRSPQAQSPIEPEPAPIPAQQQMAANTQPSASDVIKGINTTATVIHSMEVIGDALDDFFDFIVALVAGAF